MDGLLLPILIAGSVGLLVWGLVVVASNWLDREKRKLQERLAADAHSAGQSESAIQRMITYQTEALGASAVLIRWSVLQGLHKRIIQAYPEMTLIKFLGISAGLAATTFVLVLLFSTLPLAALLGGAGAGYLPFFMISRKRNKRQRAVSNQIPEALDFLSRVLRAGHSFSTGLQMMGDELPQPIAAEFKRAYEQHSLGQNLDDALKSIATRIDSTDFAFFITAVLIQRQTGGDLSEVLKNISGVIRQRIRLQQSVKAKTAEGRFTGYILVAFPAVMFVLVTMMNPDYGRVLTNTPMGQKLLALAFGLQMLGLWAIRKITTVKV